MEQQKEKKVKNYGSSSLSMSEPNSSLPVDLVSEIFLKLSAKSIVRSGCVSKLWSSITTDPLFIKSFETRSSPNPSLLIIFKNSNKLFVFSSSYTSSPHVECYQLEYPNSLCFSSMESVQGLICFRGIARRSKSDKTPRIWNPTMRKFITLPKPQTSHYWMKRTSLFLGFDPIEGKHKVVCMPRERFFDECLVLTLGSSSSWRRIKTNHYHCPDTGIYSKGRCINGVLYYKAFDRKENRVLVSFDVRSEKFKPITVPLGTIWGLPIDYKGKLAFVNYVKNGEGIKLYVLEDAEKHKWSLKSFRVPFSPYDPSLKTRFKLSGVTDGGEFIYIPSTIFKSFCIKYFDPKRQNFRKVVFDGIADDEFRLRNGLGDDPLKVLTAFPNHMESLISLGEGVGVYDKPNPWEFETTQFDDILKKLKVVINPRAHFYYDEEEEEESDEKDTVIETSLPAKRKREEIIQEPKKIKLKNLCKQILKKNGVSMKLKQLRSLIDEQAPSVLSEFSSRKDAIAHLKHKLERSGKFVVEGKKISLVSRKK